MAGGVTGKDRWLISYADFITLLFAFFVVMYAISSINEGKFRILSDSLEEAFKDPLQGLEPLELGKLREFLANLSEEDSEEAAAQAEKQLSESTEQLSSSKYAEEVPLDLVSFEVQQNFEGLIQDETIVMRQDEEWIEVEINSDVLFFPGSAALQRGSENIINKLSRILMLVPNPITVEGFTDNTPISNELYPSNWELSTDRAASMVRALIDGGVNAKRLAAMGFGQNFPIANNSTQEGREKNRRVVILIEKNNKRRSSLEETTEKDQAPIPQELLLNRPSTQSPPQPPPGDDIRGLRQEDGSLKFDATTIFDEENQGNQQ